MTRLSIRKTLKFKGKQHYAVYESLPWNKGKGEGWATSKRLSGNFQNKTKAKKFLKSVQNRRKMRY